MLARRCHPAAQRRLPLRAWSREILRVKKEKTPRRSASRDETGEGEFER
nr:MAG TPA: hypothetical protein [Caudoviricetes sp.]